MYVVAVSQVPRLTSWHSRSCWYSPRLVGGASWHFHLKTRPRRIDRRPTNRNGALLRSLQPPTWRDLACEMQQAPPQVMTAYIGMSSCRHGVVAFLCQSVAVWLIAFLVLPLPVGLWRSHSRRLQAALLKQCAGNTCTIKVQQGRETAIMQGGTYQTHTEKNERYSAVSPPALPTCKQALQLPRHLARAAASATTRASSAAAAAAR